MTVSSVGMVCNFLLILVIIIDPLIILHRGAWITILNLSFADFLACGSLFLKLLVHETMDFKTRILIEGKVDFFWMFSVGASFMLLTLLTVQIYMIIKYPMKSRLMLTRKRVLMSCMIVWVIAVCMGFGNIGNTWFRNYKVLYVFIANIAVLEIAVLFQVVVKILITVEIIDSRHRLIKAKTQKLKQQNVAKTIIILNVILIVTAFPYFLAKQMEYLERLGYLSDDLLFENFPYYYEPVALLNFIFNPLLYSLRLNDYRRSLLALFKFCYKKIQPARRESRRIATSFTGVPTKSGMKETGKL